MNCALERGSTVPFHSALNTCTTRTGYRYNNMYGRCMCKGDDSISWTLKIDASVVASNFLMRMSNFLMRMSNFLMKMSNFRMAVISVKFPDEMYKNNYRMKFYRIYINLPDEKRYDLHDYDKWKWVILGFF